MQKIGMTYEGTLIHNVLKWGQYHDLVAYGILKHTYKEFVSLRKINDEEAETDFAR